MCTAMFTHTQEEHVMSGMSVYKEVDLLLPNGPMPQENVAMEGKVLRWHVL